MNSRFKIDYGTKTIYLDPEDETPINISELHNDLKDVLEEIKRRERIEKLKKINNKYEDKNSK